MLRMKNFNILEVQWKIWLLGGREGVTKNQYRGRGFPKKGELGQSPDLRRVLERERGWCFWRRGSGLSPNAQYADLQIRTTTNSLKGTNDYAGFITSKTIFNPIQNRLFRGCSQIGGGLFGSPPSLKSATHILQWWNLAQLYFT